MKKKGFTLIELMAVAVILTILSIALSLNVTDNIKKSKDAAQIAVLAAFRSQVNIFKSNSNDNKSYSDIAALRADISLKPEEKVVTGTSNGDISTLQGEAGTVSSDNGISKGYGTFTEKNNIVEFYYNSSTGAIYIDGVSNGGTDYTEATDTKNKKWNEY